MDLKSRIGLQLRALRKAKNLTQDELAAATGLSVEAISNIERGVSLAGLDTIEKLAEAMNVELASVIGNAGGSKISKTRAELLAKLNAAVGQLSDKELSIVVRQVDVIANS